jgi:hypothetical protein
MLAIVKLNPMQLTMVRDVPLVLSSASAATRVENIGESAMTTIPQNEKNNSICSGCPADSTSGERRQQHPEANSAHLAVLPGPQILEM